MAGDPKKAEDSASFVEDIYGAPEDFDDRPALQGLRSGFQPWHHPVKQIVRDEQWGEQTVRLLDEHYKDVEVLKYLTLPGSDLLDVRAMTDLTRPRGVKVEYLGFDSGYVTEDAVGAVMDPSEALERDTAEAELRQAGKITSNCDVIRYRLEDIALKNSPAKDRLDQHGAFHIINVDACDFIGHCPPNQPRNTFDALQVLLAHQFRATKPWMLYLTTRARPEFATGPSDHFKKAVNDNLAVVGGDFRPALAACLDIDESELSVRLNDTWAQMGPNYLKLFTVGLGKYLLQFYNGQPGHQANVKLTSAYTYRIHGPEPDMLAIAFKIIPAQPVAHPATVGGTSIAIASLEPVRAVHIANRAAKLRNLDHDLETDADLRQRACDNSLALLRAARYDLSKYTAWLEAHPQRPMKLEPQEALLQAASEPDPVQS